MLPSVVAAAVFAATSMSVCGHIAPQPVHLMRPVTNAAEAFSIGYMADLRLYPKAQIDGERPLAARRNGSLWTVEGRNRADSFGGVLEVVLKAQDGTIVSICHGL
ncbi:MAG: NTF2 fold immunity protein [Caulobacteraceae bacterium]